MVKIRRHIRCHCHVHELYDTIVKYKTNRTHFQNKEAILNSYDFDEFVCTMSNFPFVYLGKASRKTEKRIYRRRKKKYQTEEAEKSAEVALLDMEKNTKYECQRCLKIQEQIIKTTKKIY